ncbi:hypothetical protein BCON_0361g00020 [Botryotinia convoluta]|uniref:BTB domain-containing protein n=1 Tax=Botryotinia convoluta TaxID=54673 RepID=A0A4Z1HER8_9HELO|nr:hypothetical protein BCON_0361g00020 [Botryotinia convoluta]
MFQSNFKEAVTNEISFERDSPHALWRVLRYIYTGDYSEESSRALDTQGDDIELLKHPRVFALADMFCMEDLKSICCQKLKSQLQAHWISDTFPECIREVYLTSNSIDANPMRIAVVDTLVSHKALLKKPSFQELVRDGGDFAADLVLALSSGR